MGRHIPESTLRLTEDVVITYDLTRFGPRQKSALCRYLRTGIVKGYSPVTNLAHGIRKHYKAGTLRTSTYGMQWNEFTRDEDFSVLTAINTICLLSGNEHIRANAKAAVEYINTHMPSGRVGWDWQNKSVFAKGLQLWTPGEIQDYADKVESGEIHKIRWSEQNHTLLS